MTNIVFFCIFVTLVTNFNNMTSENKATCGRCGAETSVSIYSSINVGEQPELKAEILDGSAFVWQCPHCGTMNLKQYQTLYHDPSEKLMVWLTRGSEELEEQVRAAYSKLEGLDDYTMRFVDDAGSLIEKIKIFDAGLDDLTMEMTKYVTKMEICESRKERAEEIMSAGFKFLKMSGPDNEITLAYPLDGQMQMVAIGFNVYEDCRGIIKRNPSIKETAPGFHKIDAAWVGRYFR